MKCSEIIACLERIAPCHLAEKWDNVGLLTGREEKEIKKIMLALDPTSQVIQQAIDRKADLLITHHPLIFSGLKSVTTGDFIGKRVYELISHDICYYAMHTNFDVKVMAGEAAKLLALEECRVLDVTAQEETGELGIGVIGKLFRGMSLKECAEFVQKTVQVSKVDLYGEPEKMIKTVALIPGSGKGYLDLALKKGADAVITGDLGHHHGLDAMEKGIPVMDAGHFGLEKIFKTYMHKVLKEELPEIQIEEAGEEEPYQVIRG